MPFVVIVVAVGNVLVVVVVVQLFVAAIVVLFTERKMPIVTNCVCRSVLLECPSGFWVTRISSFYTRFLCIFIFIFIYLSICVCIYADSSNTFFIAVCRTIYAIFTH